jgi:murein DD-endopeptidase MepM/ murein hydrolase activator NlpD
LLRRSLSLLALTLLVSAAPAAGDVSSRKASIDQRISSLQSRIAAARARESRLSAEIVAVTTRIRSLESQVGDVSRRLSVLESDLALHQRRLDALTALFRVQTQRYTFLRREYAAALARLDRRLVEIYKQEKPSAVEIVLASRSFQDMLDQLDYLSRVGRQDKGIALQVRTAKNQVRAAREQTRKLKVHVQSETQVIEVRAQQVTAVRDRLLASKHELTGARVKKRHQLTVTQESEQEFVGEVDALQAASARLAVRIQAAQSSGPPSAGDSTGAPSASGLIWPVSGPVTSPFGWRWGRMHEGIDIGAGYGTPIHAAAAGRVIYCGWEEGYGNLTVIDHGGGIATAYGHQSSIAVSCGQDVSQGQTIGYVGCTGHCTGPHLHFEVRVNGTPVDPLGYL